MKIKIELGIDQIKKDPLLIRVCLLLIEYSYSLIFLLLILSLTIRTSPMKMRLNHIFSESFILKLFYSNKFLFFKSSF